MSAGPRAPVLCAWLLAASAAAGGPGAALPDAVAVARGEGLELHLEAYAWRDFMPVSPPGGKPLAVVVRVTGRASHPVRVTGVWVASGAEVWHGAAQPRSPAAPGVLAEGVARGGPHWPPGSTVAVVADVQGADGVHWMLRAPAVQIEATH